MTLKITDRIKQYEKKEQIKCQVLDIDELVNVKSSKLLFLGNFQEIVAIIANSGQFINNYKIMQSEDDYVEIVNKELNKGMMIDELVKYLGITGEVMTIGNQMNDKELVEVADYGIAVANAVDELKQYADYITRDSFENGVIEAIKKFT